MFHCIAMHFNSENQEKDVQWVSDRYIVVFKCFSEAGAFL